MKKIKHKENGGKEEGEKNKKGKKQSGNLFSSRNDTN
jgi:hypothetical protein